MSGYYPKVWDGQGPYKAYRVETPIGAPKSVIGLCLLWYMNGKWIEHALVARNRSYWFFKTFKVPYIAIMIYEGLIKNKVLYVPWSRAKKQRWRLLIICCLMVANCIVNLISFFSHYAYSWWPIGFPTSRITRLIFFTTNDLNLWMIYWPVT